MDSMSADPEAQTTELVLNFAERYGRPHLDLACHAAFPIVLTPEMLYQIWAEFVPEAPWTAVCDVLLSSLCREIGYELYAMDLPLRNMLQRRLQTYKRYGQPQISRLSQFLQRLVENLGDANMQEAQNWAALVYSDPAKVLDQIAAAYQILVPTAPRDCPAALRLASLVRTFSVPLSQSSSGDDYNRLALYATRLEDLLRGHADPQAESFSIGSDTVIIGNRALPQIPASLGDTVAPNANAPSDYAPAQWIAANSLIFTVGRQDQKPIAIVNHITQATVANITAQFTAAEPTAVSVHYVVSASGQVLQFVREADMAYANGVLRNPNLLALPWLAEAQSRSTNPNLLTISIAWEGLQAGTWGQESWQQQNVTTLKRGSVHKWWTPTDEQYQAGLALLHNIVARWNISSDRAHICRHSDFDSVTKWFSPGSGFPLTKLLADLGPSNSDAATGTSAADSIAVLAPPSKPKTATLAPALYSQLRQALLYCDEFGSDSALFDFFSTSPLDNFQSDVPSRSNTNARVQAVLAAFKNRSFNGVPVLALILEALRDVRVQGDDQWAELDTLAQQVRAQASDEATGISAADSIAVLAPPSISQDKFTAILSSANSPVLEEDKGAGYYQLCVSNGIDPAVALALFQNQSNYGTAPGSAERKNWAGLRDSGTAGERSFRRWQDGLAEFCALVLTFPQPLSLRSFALRFFPDPQQQTAFIATALSSIHSWQEEGAGTDQQPVTSSSPGANDPLPPELSSLFADPTWVSTGLRLVQSVCRIDVSDSYGQKVFGTGFLIAPDKVLTSYSLIAAVAPDVQSDVRSRVPPLLPEIELRFGLQPADAVEPVAKTGSPDEGGPSEPAVYQLLLSANWLISSSAADELNYALLQLNDKTGLHSPPPDWIKPAPRPMSRPGSPLVLIYPILDADQTPDAALQAHTGVIVAVSDTTITYRAQTRPGFSGAPIFDANWQLIGMHQSRAQSGEAQAVNIAAILSQPPVAAALGFDESAASSATSA